LAGKIWSRSVFFSAFLAMFKQTLAPSRIDRLHLATYLGHMSIVLIVAAVIGVFLLVYLTYSIVRPDKF
jgi:K+-transporting ATPase KdpF subunit